ncbi:MAG: 30S ribosomal protein S4 [Candidatus Firestonebacteria bacterium]
MSRHTESKCKLCRREKVKMFLKGDRCFTPKCALEKRQTAPGQHGKKPTKLSEYGIRLREKQKAKRMYGLNEGQFKRFFEIASRKPGVTGLHLLKLLESRLDNVVFRSGFGASRDQARQLVMHGHVLVDGGCVNIPSYILKPNEVITLKPKAKELKGVKAAVERIKERGMIPSGWLEVNLDLLSITYKKMPEKDEIGAIVNEQLIVEFYRR